MIKLRHREVEKSDQGPVAMQVTEADINQAVRRLPDRKDPTISTFPLSPKVVGSGLLLFTNGSYLRALKWVLHAALPESSPQNIHILCRLQRAW